MQRGNLLEGYGVAQGTEGRLKSKARSSCLYASGAVGGEEQEPIQHFSLKLLSLRKNFNSVQFWFVFYCCDVRDTFHHFIIFLSLKIRILGEGCM